MIRAEAREARAAVLDDGDVPASVTCARCGALDDDCPGCHADAAEAAPRQTPWEETDLPRWQRLFRTARLVTLEGEAFFGNLADGSVASALGFAVTCEVLSIASLLVSWIPLLYVLVPGYVTGLVADAALRSTIMIVFVVAVAALSLLMVALHVFWALSLELGVRVSGAKTRVAHCVRYALYSCGWDFLTSPLGFVAGCADRGFRVAAAELLAAVRIPRFATEAYVERSRRLSKNERRRALTVAATLTGTLVLSAAVAVGVVVVRALV